MHNSVLPDGYHIEPLVRKHPRRKFHCGEAMVDDWLATKALQHQRKRLSVTKVLVDKGGSIAGYYTLATSHVDFGDLPLDVTRKLPRRALPVAVLAWLGASLDHRGQGLGRWLLARALRDCYEAGQIFAFVAIVIDCLSDEAKRFYQKWDFDELPGNPYRLYITAAQLDSMMNLKE